MARGKAIHPSVSTALRQGLTVAELALAFRMAKDTVIKRLAQCRPGGERDGETIYIVRDAARHLASLPPDVIDRVIRSNPMDLPAVLKKEFWQGHKARLEVMESEGEIWRTDDIAAFVGEAFQSIKMDIMLMRDGVERNTELTSRQRDVLQNLIDGVLVKISETLKDTFREKIGGRVGSRPEGTFTGTVEPVQADDIDPTHDI